MWKPKRVIIICIIIVLIISACIIGANLIARKNNTELPASTVITKVKAEDPTISSTIDPTTKPTAPDNMEINDDIESSSDLKSWISNYSYYEYYPPDENMIYSLSIYQEGVNYYADILIDGFQTNHHIKAKVTGDDYLISIVFDKYLPKNDYEPYKKGDILLNLKKDKSKLITIWEEIQPMLLNTPKESVCFEIQSSSSSKNTDKQTKATYDDQWKQVYIDYIQNTLINNGWDGYELIKLDNDDIPELVAIGCCEAQGNLVCNYYNGTVYSTQLSRLGFYYIERKNLLCNSEGLMDNYYDIIYSLIDGKLTQIVAGYWGELDGSGHHFDKDGNLVYQYSWDGNSVTEDEYKKYLNSVFDMSKSTDGYTNQPCSIDEMINLIKSY